jgi:Tat protein secretion system quality control protein TatD with DNase activity
MHPWQWAKWEKEDVGTISEWVNTVRSLVYMGERGRRYYFRMGQNCEVVNTKKILKKIRRVNHNSCNIDLNVAKHLHEKYVVGPADKAAFYICYRV